MKVYFIELNGSIIKSYRNKEKAIAVAKGYALNPENSVCVWCDHVVVWSNTEY